MNPIEALRDYIRRAHTAAKLELLGPLHKEGVWSLDIDLADKKLAVEWSQETGFGISNIDTEGYGERPDETYGTLKEIKQRVNRLLTSAERTSPPFGILLSRLREHRKVTQAELAQRLGIKQATVSGIERREDVQVSTLWRAVGALDGTLEVYAVFRDARYRTRCWHSRAGAVLSESPLKVNENRRNKQCLRPGLSRHLCWSRGSWPSSKSN